MRVRLTVAIIASVILATDVSARELTATEKAVIATALANSFLDPPSAQFIWTSWEEPGPGNGTIFYCGEVNAKGADGKYGGYVPLSRRRFREVRQARRCSLWDEFPSPPRAGSPMRQCMGRADLKVGSGSYSTKIALD